MHHKEFTEIVFRLVFIFHDNNINYILIWINCERQTFSLGKIVQNHFISIKRNFNWQDKFLTIMRNWNLPSNLYNSIFPAIWIIKLLKIMLWACPYCTNSPQSPSKSQYGRRLWHESEPPAPAPTRLRRMDSDNGSSDKTQAFV